jgi:putative transposase
MECNTVLGKIRMPVEAIAQRLPKMAVGILLLQEVEIHRFNRIHHDKLRDMVRKKAGKKQSPSLGLIDSQSVKTSSVTKDKGIDGNKKINGRKRHVMTDTLGLVMAIIVLPANVNDRQGARELLERVRYKYGRLVKILADQGYTGQLADWVKQTFGWVLEIVEKVSGEGKFNVLPKRWIIERTFGWFNFQRRLAKDYETLSSSSEAMVHLAMIRMMLNKIEN